MRTRAFPVAAVLVLAVAACSSGNVDRLATDTCEVLQAHQAGEISVAEVDREFGFIVERAVELEVAIDLVEAQVQVQCFDALQAYVEASAGE